MLGKKTDESSVDASCVTTSQEDDDQVSVCSSMDTHELDELIDGEPAGNPEMLLNGYDSDKENIDPTLQLCKKSFDVDGIILDKCCEDEIIPKLPPVNSKLEKCVTTWLHSLPSREKVKELFKDCLLPENVQGLQPVRINQLLYNKLPFSFRVNDQRLCGMNTYICWGLGPIVGVWDSLLEIETMTSCAETKVSIDKGTLSCGDKTFNIKDLHKDLHKGLRLLCASNAVLLDKRHQQLHPFLDHRYHYLLKPDNPITTELLGDNVDQKIVDANKIFDAACKLHVCRKTLTPKVSKAFKLDARLKIRTWFIDDHFFHGTPVVQFLTIPETSTANHDILSLITEGALSTLVTVIHEVNNELSLLACFPLIQIWWKVVTPYTILVFFLYRQNSPRPSSWYHH